MVKKMSLKIVLIIEVIVMILTMTLCFVNIAEPTAVETVVIKQGQSGTQVETIQTKLKNWGYYTGNVDGIFGSLTTSAIKSFQRANGLTVDGIVGSATAGKLGITLSSGSSSNSGYSGSDEYLLAKCIHAEARGEPYIGQVAVGAVVLNRVRHPSFPNTISGVIYQPWAFTAVYDGQMDLEPNEESKRAARDALSGWDPTYGCIYYYNPSTATSSWIWTREVRLSIGEHSFAI